MEEVFFAKEVYQILIISFTAETAFVDNSFVFTNRLEALQSGQLGGAALDVLVKEPPPKDYPLIIAAQTMPNLIITPHVAWASDSAITTMVNKVRSNIEEFYQTGK